MAGLPPSPDAKGPVVWDVQVKAVARFQSAHTAWIFADENERADRMSTLRRRMHSPEVIAAYRDVMSSGFVDTSINEGILDVVLRALRALERHLGTMGSLFLVMGRYPETWKCGVAPGQHAPLLFEEPWGPAMYERLAAEHGTGWGAAVLSPAAWVGLGLSERGTLALFASLKGVHAAWAGLASYDVRDMEQDHAVQCLVAAAFLLLTSNARDQPTAPLSTAVATTRRQVDSLLTPFLDGGNRMLVAEPPFRCNNRAFSREEAVYLSFGDEVCADQKAVYDALAARAHPGFALPPGPRAARLVPCPLMRAPPPDDPDLDDGGSDDCDDDGSDDGNDDGNDDCSDDCSDGCSDGCSDRRSNTRGDGGSDCGDGEQECDDSDASVSDASDVTR